MSDYDDDMADMAATGLPLDPYLWRRQVTLIGASLAMLNAANGALDAIENATIWRPDSDPVYRDLMRARDHWRTVYEAEFANLNAMLLTAGRPAPVADDGIDR
jgi:hypothetical protein